MSPLPTGRFTDLDDGGRALAPLVAEAVPDRDGVVVLGIVPNGVPAAVAVATALHAPLLPLTVHRPADGPPRVDPVAGLDGRIVVVVDDGVETGTVARLVASALRDVGARRLVLAVPVCPRDSQATLDRVYDRVLAVVRPLGRRALSWHYETMAALDPAQALARVDAYGRGRSGRGD